MKKIAIIFAGLSVAFAAQAQLVSDQPQEDSKKIYKQYKKEERIEKAKVNYRFSLAVQIGTDIGGAIPVPLRYIPDKFNPYPSIFPSIGAKVTVPLDNTWSLSAEVTYKSVGMEADALVENQRFQSEGDVLYFSGSATMNMRFDMVEVPLYVRFNFSDRKINRVFLGPYFAYMLRSKFETTAKKGFQGSSPDNVGAIIKEPFVMDFNNSLGNFDVGLLAGYERRLLDRVDISLRVQFGFKDIFKKNNKYFDYKMWHMRGGITLSYDLFRIRDK